MPRAIEGASLPSATSIFRSAVETTVPPEAPVLVFEGGEGERTLEGLTLTGWRNGVVAEIRNGIEAGDRVLAHPSDRVIDGARITSRH